MFESLLSTRPALPDLNTNDLPSLLVDSTGWQNRPAYGWYKEVPHNGGSAVATFIPEVVNMSLISEFSVTINAYYNSPSQSMHDQFLRITLSDGRKWKVHTNDAWVATSELQRYYENYEPTGASTVGNQVNRIVTFTVPSNVTITAMEISSGYYSGYVSGVRGMKDFKFKYRN